MNWLQELSKDENLKSNLFLFLNQYGKPGLDQALRTYTDLQQEYICRTKTSISKVSIYDILYLKIRNHHITVYTQHNTYQKYGSLNRELKFLAPYGFIKCSQSCIVSRWKISKINGNDIILINGTKLHMSRNYTPKVLIEFNRKCARNKT